VSGLAHFLESEGIATIVLGLIPHHVRAMEPPRALLLPFELGRPLGAPHNPKLQREVLCAALDLLDNPGPAPVVASFDTETSTDTDDAEPWVCPVSFPKSLEINATSSLAERIAAEAVILQPWFELGIRQRGHTAADASGMPIAELIGWLSEFLSDPAPTESPRAEASLTQTFKLAVEDLKAFYLEAITVQPHSGSANDINTWFWEETMAGQLLWDLREQLGEHPEEGIRLHAQFTLVPAEQVARRS
jgi:hypothetical protein